MRGELIFWEFMLENSVIRLHESRDQNSIIYLSCRVDARSLSADKITRWVTLTRTGDFNHPQYGNFSITRELLESLVKNFEAKTYGQEIVIDLSHKPQDGAAGFVRRLQVEGDGNSYKLRGLVEFTNYGIEAVNDRGYIYLSVEYVDNYIPPEEPRREFGPTLLGAALTPRPHVKHLDPVQLTAAGPDGEQVMLISDRIIKILSEESKAMKLLLEQLAAKLAGLAIPANLTTQLVESFKKVAEPMATDDLRREYLTTYLSSIEPMAKQLVEAAASGQSIQLSIAAPAGDGLSADDVKRILSEAQTESTKALAESTKRATDNVARFSTLLTEAKLEGLDDDDLKLLDEFSELITADSTEEQVKSLADRAINMGNRLASAKKLGALGYQIPGTAGSVRIIAGESSTIKQLQEHVDQRMGIGSLGDARRFAATGGALTPENKAFADKVLAEFDARNARALHNESRQLAGGDASVSDVVLPTSFERTVIREALYQLRGTQLVDVNTATFGSVVEIPYSYRDTSAAGLADIRRFEGQGISNAGIIQTTDETRPIPQKLAFLISDELRYLMQAGQIQWDAVAENRTNASRMIAEDTDLIIHNDLLLSADEFGAVAVSAEVIPGAATDGTNNIFPLVNFPVVRPRSIYDLKGDRVGNTANPVTVEYDTGGGYGAVSEFNGTGTQPAGTYYRLRYNHGELSICDESGAIVTPGATDNIRVSYSYSTNTYRFDTDLGGDALKVHWDQFLLRFGLRKNVIQDDRFYECNFAAMSGNTMTSIEQAETFGANFSKPGTNLNDTGDLGRVKGVPGFRTAAPGINIGDQRIVMGQRGIGRFRMLKPWSMNEMENSRNSTGQFTGKKSSYGDQFIAMTVPEPLKRALTTMTLYSATVRVARAG